MPTSDPEGYVLHQRLLAGDPLVTVDLAERYLDPLADWLIAGNRNLDPHLCEEAAEEALLALFRAPRSYDPAKSTLTSYLYMSARGDLLNLLRKDRRYRRRHLSLEAVELSPTLGNYSRDGDADPLHLLIEDEDRREVLARVPPVPAMVQASLTAKEAQVLELMREGERRTAVYAGVLAITHLPPDEQQRVVKRCKDKLQKRMQRAGDPHVS